MSEKSKYCEKAVSIHTLAYLERFEDLKKQPKVNKDDIIFLRNKFDGIKSAHGVKLTFKVESIHESGLVIARKILPNGRFGPSEIVNDGPWMVEVDHTYIENIIMNNEEKYDPSVAITELEKEKRRVTKYNKSISFKSKDKDEIDTFLKSLKTGDIIWYSDTLIGLKDYRCEVIGEPYVEVQQGYKWNNTPTISYIKVPIKKYYTYQGTVSNYTTSLCFSSTANMFITKEEPLSVKE
jgi:hypothetical protein